MTTKTNATIATQDAMNNQNKEDKKMTTATENTNATINTQEQNKEEEKKAMEAKKQAEKEAKVAAKKAEQEKKAAEKAKKAEERKAAKEKAEAEKKAKAEKKAHAKENAQGVIDKALENVDHKYTPNMGRTTVLNGKVGMFYMEVGQKAVIFHSKEDMVPEGVTAKVVAGNPVNPYAVTVAHEELEKVLGQYLSKMEQVKAARNEAKAKALAEKEAEKKAEKEAKAKAKAEEKARKAAEKEAAKKAKAEAKKAEERKAE